MHLEMSHKRRRKRRGEGADLRPRGHESARGQSCLEIRGRIVRRHLWGSLPIAGGLEVAYKSELEASDDPEATLEAIRERLDKVTSPFRSAEMFNVEDIIDPRDTRPLLCEFAELAWRKLAS